MAQTLITPCRPDAAVLRLHRYLWLPARYAHPQWLIRVGFHPPADWRYGERPSLDRCLNQVLLTRRGTPALPAVLNVHQQRRMQLSGHLHLLALAAGLLALQCHDYFLLPAYRRVLSSWFEDDLLWQLFGLCQGEKRAVVPAEQLTDMALQLGTAILSRAAQSDPVLFAMLITLPPCKRALWPSLPANILTLLERILCSAYR